MQNSGFWIVLTGVGVYGAAHSLLAAHFVKRWVERAWGPAARRFYRLAYSAAAGLGLLSLLGLAYMLPDARIYTIPFPWVLLTLALQGAAGWCLLVAVARTGMPDFIGLRQVSSPAPLIAAAPDPAGLVTTGFYRFVRHPLYSFSFVLLWLMPWMSWNLLALCAGFSLYMLAGIWFEERKLAAEFGPAYTEYRRRTKMLIPGVF